MMGLFAIDSQPTWHCSGSVTLNQENAVDVMENILFARETVMARSRCWSGKRERERERERERGRERERV